MKFLFLLSLVLFFSSNLFSNSILLKSGTKIDVKSIEKETEEDLIVTTIDGFIIKIQKDKIESMNLSNKDSLKEEKPPLEPKNSKEDLINKENSSVPTAKDYKIFFSQSMNNDANIRGASIFGERLNRRDNTPYNSFAQAWVLATAVQVLAPLKGLRMQLISANAVSHRNNVDSDGRLFQNGPGGEDVTNKSLNDLQSGKLTFDPNQTKRHPERNGLKDFIIGGIYYDWEMGSFGGFTTGLFYVNNTDPYRKNTFTEINMAWKLPFFRELLSPTLNIFNRISSETSTFNNLNNGSTYLSFGGNHDFRKKEYFRFSISSQLGYQYNNNNTDRRSGFSDLSSKIQFFLGQYFLALNHVYRPDVYLWDTDRNFPKIGTYGDINANDGKTVDPSKVNGPLNQFVADQIKANSPNDIVARALTENYQQQKIVRNIFFISFGYTLIF